MNNMSLLRRLSLTAALLVLPAVVHAIPISILGSGDLGSFTGSFEYTPGGDDLSGTVDVELENTSLASNEGFITAFVFNLPTGASVSSALLTTVAAFGVIGGPSFSDSANGAPFGQFDIGASTGDSFEGGGAPNVGLAVGESATFSFALTGTGLGSLTAGDFLSALSVPPGDGEGLEAFVVRFRGFNEGGSDKVPATVVPPVAAVPEPATALLLGLGLTGLLGRRRRTDGR